MITPSDGLLVLGAALAFGLLVVVLVGFVDWR